MYVRTLGRLHYLRIDAEVLGKLGHHALIDGAGIVREGQRYRAVARLKHEYEVIASARIPHMVADLLEPIFVSFQFSRSTESDL